MLKKYKDIFNGLSEDSNSVNRILVVDGLNTFIRTWTNMPNMNDDGDHVGGVVGFLKSIGAVIRDLRITRCIIVFDGKNGSQNRKKQYSGYKAQRTGNKLRVNRQYKDMMSDEDESVSMKRQFVWLNDILNYLPVTTMIYDGVEADDVISYISTELRNESDEIIILSTDKDFLQLVNEKTFVWSPVKKKLYDTKLVKDEYGLESKNLLLYRILDGDSSDNIPGIKGCGLKTILKRFPELSSSENITVDEFLKLTEEKNNQSNGKIQVYKNILENRDTIYLNEKLMQLSDTDISGIIKMNILTKYGEKVNPLSKMQFFSILLKYKVADSFGDLHEWLKNTFSNLRV